MPIVKLVVTEKRSGEEVTIVGEPSDEDVSLFEEFMTCYANLVDCEWFRSGMRLRASIAWKEGTGWTVGGDLPSSDRLSAFLHRLRPFILQNERTYFYRVCKLIDHLFASAPLRQLTDFIRHKYSGGDMQSRMTVSSNGVVINTEDTLNKWLNAFEYHRDLEKREYLQSLHTHVPLETSKALFLSMLIDRVAAVADLAAIVALVLGRRDQVDVDTTANAS